jgi:hypothetical protein
MSFAARLLLVRQVMVSTRERLQFESVYTEHTTSGSYYRLQAINILYYQHEHFRRQHSDNKRMYTCKLPFIEHKYTIDIVTVHSYTCVELAVVRILQYTCQGAYRIL